MPPTTVTWCDDKQRDADVIELIAMLALTKCVMAQHA